MARAELRDFSGLLNTRVNPLLRKRSELAVARNVESEPIGALSKRTGYTQVGDTVDANSVVGLWDHATAAGVHTLLRVSGTKVYKLAAGVFSDITGAVTLTSGSDASMATLNGVTAGFNKAYDAPWKWSGSGNIAALGGTPPSAAYAKVYKSKLYTLNTSANPYRNQFSNAGNAELWTATDYFDYPDSTDPGTGLSVRNDRLVSHSGFLSYRWDTLNLVRIPVDVGAVSQTSIAENDVWEFMLSRAGVVAYEGGLPRVISAKIKDYIDGIAGSSLVDTNAGTKGDYYYLATTAATQDISANGVLRYNFRQANWAAWDLAHKPNVWARYIDSSSVDQMAFGDSAGHVWQMSSTAYDDGGTRIESEFESGPHFLFGPEVTASYDRIYIIGSGMGGMDLQVKIDDGDYQSLTVLTDTFARADINSGEGRSITVRGTEAGTSAPWKIYAIVVYATPKGEM